MGADCLTIKMFSQEYRIEQANKTRYELPFIPEYVFAGIGEHSRLLSEGSDYRLTDGAIEFSEALNVLIDCYSGCAWPERFNREELANRRRDTRTINEWDSQYQLHSKPVGEVRLDPDRMIPYEVEPQIRTANRQISMWLGNTQIVGAVAYWDCSLGKITSDASAFTLILTDDRGQLYWHLAEGLTGELAEFDDKGRITGGQVVQVRDLVIKYQIPRVIVETNGPGGFVPNILRQALKGTGCGINEEHSSVNKNKRILDAFEPPLSSGFLWAHVGIFDGPAYDQMRSFNPIVTSQPDDYIDSAAGAIRQTPVRIGKIVGKPTGTTREDWRPEVGTFEVTTDY